MTTSKVHRRYNPLKKEFILVSPHRMQRPWQGQTENSSTEQIVDFDDSCYLCPGNTRANDKQNEAYTSTYTFKNDFSALLPKSDFVKSDMSSDSVLFKTEECSGECEVICFSPNHSKSMGSMTQTEVLKVVKQWSKSYADKSEKFKYCQIFENKGAVMGCSNPHPHGQMWCSDYYPSMIEIEIDAQNEFKNANGIEMLMCYGLDEIKAKERLIFQNESFVLVTPFWACWPYELLILPKKQMQTLKDLNESEQEDLALVLLMTTRIYDNLFNMVFPYSMGLHQAEEDGFTFHIHFYPPLLNATRKKFIAGFELLGECQRDSLVESIAEELRQVLLKINNN
eukprot:NODE_132_length_16614_cov_0.935392.p7 type:complete len:339 gc:universal NODE_132_length_16614_cov_0.935392:9350-10366(+)